MSVSPQSLEGGAPVGQTDGVIAKAASGAKYALFLLFAINLLNFFDRQLLGALGEPVRHEFHLSDTALGLLGTIFTIIYAFVGLPLGALSDKWYRNRLIAIGTAFWSLLTAATGFAQNYAQIFVARLGVGIVSLIAATWIALHHSASASSNAAWELRAGPSFEAAQGGHGAQGARGELLVRF